MAAITTCLIQISRRQRLHRKMARLILVILNRATETQEVWVAKVIQLISATRTRMVVRRRRDHP